MSLNTRMDEDGNFIVTQTIGECTMCINQLNDLEKVVIIETNDQLEEYINLLEPIKYDYPFKSTDTIFYTVDGNVNAARYYYFLTLLVNRYPEKEFNFSDKERYEPGNKLIDTVCSCSKTNALSTAVFGKGMNMCDKAGDIVIENKTCMMCPIRSGCIKCKTANRFHICSMHQAEAMACIYYHFKHKSRNAEPYRGHIPYLWTKNFGTTVSKIINNYRNIESLRWLSNEDDVYFNLYITDPNNGDQLDSIKSYLEGRMISYRDIELNSISLTIDKSELLKLQEYMIQFCLYDVEFSYKKRNHHDIFSMNNHNYRKCDPYYINDLLFSLEENKSDIRDTPYYQQGPHNPYTDAMIRTIQIFSMKDKHVLDLGCGKGLLSVVAKHYGATKVIGVDIDKNAKPNWNMMIELNGMDDRSMQFFHMSAKDFIDYYRGKFDYIFCNMTFSTINKEVIKNISKLMHPKSKLIISGFNTIIESRVIDMVDQTEILTISECYYYNDIEVVVIELK